MFDNCEKLLSKRKQLAHVYGRDPTDLEVYEEILRCRECFKLAGANYAQGFKLKDIEKIKQGGLDHGELGHE